MGACRETQDLFREYKNKNWKRFWWLIKNYNKTTHEDTWMPLICKMKGHKPYQPDPKWEPDEWACKRCHRWIDYSLKKQRKDKLDIIKKK